MNWLSIVVPPPGFNGSLSSIVYNPETGQLEITMDMNEDVPSTSLNFALDLSGQGLFFQYISFTPQTVSMVADNNQALVFYPPENYILAKAVNYISTAIGGLVLAVMLIGLFGRKLVGLETAAVIQIAYLSMISLDLMSPTFAALSVLGLSCGFHKFEDYNMSQSIGKPFKGVELDLFFLKNYNIMMLLIFIPLLLALVAKILEKTCLKSRKNLLKIIF